MKWLIIMTILYADISAFGGYNTDQCRQLSDQINSQQQSIDFDSAQNCGLTVINKDKKAVCDGLSSRRNTLQSLRDKYNKKCQ